MSFVDQVFNDVITPFLEPRIKKSSIKAVKSYVKTIDGLRKGAIGLIGMSAIASVFVTGLALIVVAIIGLLPLDPRAALFAILAVGMLMTGIGAFLVYGGLREEVWLQKSKANEMIEAVLKPWPTAYSVPDPRRIFSGQESEAQRSYDKNRELVQADLVARNYESVERQIPPGAFASLDTPDAALVSRTIDTTAPLRHP